MESGLLLTLCVPISLDHPVGCQHFESDGGKEMIPFPCTFSLGGRDGPKASLFRILAFSARILTKFTFQALLVSPGMCQAGWECRTIIPASSVLGWGQSAPCPRHRHRTPGFGDKTHGSKILPNRENCPGRKSGWSFSQYSVKQRFDIGLGAGTERQTPNREQSLEGRMENLSSA